MDAAVVVPVAGRAGGRTGRRARGRAVRADDDAAVVMMAVVAVVAVLVVARAMVFDMAGAGMMMTDAGTVVAAGTMPGSSLSYSRQQGQHEEHYEFLHNF